MARGPREEPPPPDDAQPAGNWTEDVDAPPHQADQTDPVLRLMGEFNERYMVVNEAGKALVYEKAHDPLLNRSFYARISFEDFKRLYSNRKIQITTKDGKIIFKPAAEIWLNSPGRRQHIGGVTFDPSGRRVRDDLLNLWRGFAITSKPGTWKRLRDHILDVICAGNREHYDFLYGWMARLMQRPAEQGEVAVVMRGGEGTGKGTLAKALLHILGQHGIAISNSKHLTGNFNGHLRDSILLFADEAFFAGDKQHVGVLKSIITEPFLTIEAKYQNAVQMPNFVHLIMASNEEWVVPASLDARRFFVVEVASHHANDHPYFAAIQAELDNGGYEAMLHDLLNYDLTFYNPRKPPITEGLQTQRKLSLPLPEEWWRECLHRGYVFRSKLGLDDFFMQWHPIMSTDVLFDSYETFARARNERHPMSREIFGKFMSRMGAKATRRRNVVVGEHIVDVDKNPYGDTQRKAKLITNERPHVFSVGTLDQAREAFGRITRLETEWPTEEGDDV